MGCEEEEVVSVFQVGGVQHRRWSISNGSEVEKWGLQEQLRLDPENQGEMRYASARSSERANF